MTKLIQKFNKPFSINSNKITPIVVQALIIGVFVLIITTSITAHANDDKNLLKKAQNAFITGNYKMALGYTKQILKTTPTCLEAYLINAQIYSTIDSTLLTYQTILEAEKNITQAKLNQAFYLQKAQTAQKLNYTSQAIEAYNKILEINQLNTKPNTNLIKQCNFIVNALKNKDSITIIPLPNEVNTAYDEYAPSIIVNTQQIVFTKLVETNLPNNNKFLQEDFYITTQLNNKTWQPALPFNGVNTLNNEGAQTISANGELLIYTGCNYREGLGSCDLYYTQKYNNHWTIPQNAKYPINSEYWEAQPALDANNQTIYFTSNRPGGFGGMDIWKSELTAITPNYISFSEPQNLGPVINSAENEQAPFIHADGQTLFFASNRKPNIGGYDIFYTRLINDSTWEQPQNAGVPINSIFDETSMIVDAITHKAYLVSNRITNHKRDIFEANLPNRLLPKAVLYITGTVYDSTSLIPICANVSLYNTRNNRNIKALKTCAPKDTSFLMLLPQENINDTLIINAPNYLYQTIPIKTALKDTPLTEQKNIKLTLQKLQINQIKQFANTLFETDSFAINQVALPELHALGNFLEQNPQVVIKITGHTDDTGTKEHNSQLSLLRAQSVANWLMQNYNIKTWRLAIEGQGATQPLISNATEQQRAQNRRTEIKIIAINATEK